MATLYCARCPATFEPDDDHAWIDLEAKYINDRNEKDEYALCMDCFLEVSDEWRSPA